jgi:RNA polymerase sigma-70 factor (ECF subfamily)
LDDVQLSGDVPKDLDCWCVLAQAACLKPEYAEILRRVDIDGLAVTIVAGELGLSSNNAMVRLHRARKALRARMAEHCGTTSARSCSDCGCEERGCCTVP